MLSALVGAETVLLLLLTVVVIALLRSHAEILRRLGDGSDSANDAERELIAPAWHDGTGRAALDVAGSTLRGDAIKLAVGAGKPPTLLAFLTSGCSVCEGFWTALGQGCEAPGGARVIAVTKDASHERLVRLRELASERAPVVMSTAAWEGYAVPAAPYFIFFDGHSDAAAGEGTASGWAGLHSLLSDQLAERGVGGDEPTSLSTGPRPSRTQRARDVDRTLEDAGIRPGHPTLHPSGAREPHSR